MSSDLDLRNKFSIAEKLFLEKKTQEAISTYKEILSADPNILPAINNLGTAYESLNNFLEAERYYLQCFNLNQKEIVSINNIANLFLKQTIIIIKFNIIHKYKQNHGKIIFQGAFSR